MTVSFKAAGAWSGGGLVVARNINLALETSGLASLPDRETELDIHARNVPPLSELAHGGYALLPQNAWPWASVGVREPSRELGRKYALRVLSDIAIRRAKAVIRISAAIPSDRAETYELGHNVLDEEFEADLSAAEAMSTPWATSETILSFGPFWSYKRHDVVVSAYEQYLRDGGDGALVLAGPVGSAAVFARLSTRLSALPRARLIPRTLDRSLVLAAMRSARTVVFPSAVEASPINLLEAIAVGAPVIASSIAGHVDLARSAGASSILFYPVDDPRLLADHMGSIESGDVRGRDVASAPVQSVPGRSTARTEWCGRLVDILRHIMDA